jgi:hypothetical protein
MARLPRTAWVSLLAVLALLTGALPSSASTDPPRRLLVFGDSMALEAKPFLRAELPAWRIRQDVAPARRARDAAPAMRARGARLAPVVHLSLGTEDDPDRPRAFRSAVRRAMRVAGPSRCVVWTNIWRLAGDGSGLRWDRLNRVLDDEAAHRPNLIIVDWVAMVAAHPEWLNKRDATHVDEHGSRARARAVAHAAHECRRIAAGGLG